jgi:hypothetical protein
VLLHVERTEEMREAVLKGSNVVRLKWRVTERVRDLRLVSTKEEEDEARPTRKLWSSDLHRNRQIRERLS